MIKKRGELSDRTKVKFEDARAKDERHQAMLISAFKSFGVLNGAGVVAMLGFIQALVGKSEFAVFKPYGLISLVLFMVGAFCSAAIFFTLTLILNTDNSTKSDRIVTTLALTMLVLCALGGAGYCAWGIFKAL